MNPDNENANCALRTKFDTIQEPLCHLRRPVYPKRQGKNARQVTKSAAGIEELQRGIQGNLHQRVLMRTYHVIAVAYF